MTTFKKLLIALIFILIVEIIFIYGRYKIASSTDTFKPKSAKSNYVIVVDFTSNILGVFKDGKIMKSYAIAGGKPSTPSPIGTWRIVSKDTWGEGFGGHWMGFNVPWGRYGIHGTIFPNSIGWASSHGCIRMRNTDIAELYKIIPYGTTVIVWGGPYGNFGEHLRNLKPGDTGSDVYQLQLILNEKGYYKAKPDGVYGDYLKSVIHQFQKQNELPISDVITYNFYSKLGIYLTD
jgi:hypothetical protein